MDAGAHPCANYINLKAPTSCTARWLTLALLLKHPVQQYQNRASGGGIELTVRNTFSQGMTGRKPWTSSGLGQKEPVAAAVRGLILLDFQSACDAHFLHLGQGAVLPLKSGLCR